MIVKFLVALILQVCYEKVAIAIPNLCFAGFENLFFLRDLFHSQNNNLKKARDEKISNKEQK